MKTIANPTIGKLVRNLFLIGTICLITIGCSSENTPFGVNEESSTKTIDNLNVNVKYAESYDQQYVVYSRKWPKSVATSLSKKKSGNGELLVDFEETHEIVGFDEEGYMYSYKEFLEGDGEMNMPQQVYNDLRETIPARQNDYDPIVKIEMKDGVTKSFGKSGRLVSEYAYDPEEFRITPEILDSLASLNNDSTEVENSIRNNINRLEDENVTFAVVENFYAKYDKQASSEAIDKGIGSYKFFEDLRTGNIVQSAVMREDGQVDSITMNRYKNVNGTQVLLSEETFRFGNLDGEWQVIERSEMLRYNIKVIKK